MGVNSFVQVNLPWEDISLSECSRISSSSIIFMSYIIKNKWYFSKLCFVDSFVMSLKASAGKTIQESNILSKNTFMCKQESKLHSHILVWPYVNGTLKSKGQV